MKALVTGAGGFIGMHASLKLLNRGGAVVGLENLNDHYRAGIGSADPGGKPPWPS